jgi:hypothetical protein
VVGELGVPDGPPDLAVVLARSARAVEVTECRRASLDEFVVHDAHCRLVCRVLTASLESQNNSTPATDGVLTAKEPAAALSETVNDLRHEGDCLHVGILGATGEGFILPRSEGPPPISTPIGVATALPVDSTASRVRWR